MDEVRPGALNDSIDELRFQLEELRASRSRVVAAADAEQSRASSASSTTTTSSTWSLSP